MKDEYWAEQVDIQRRGAEAWVLFAEGKKDARDRGDDAKPPTREDKTDKSAVTPGPLAPAREMLGYMLLENQPAEGRAGRVRSRDEEGTEPFPGASMAPARRRKRRSRRAKAKGYFKQIVGDVQGRRRPTGRNCSMPAPTRGN